MQKYLKKFAAIFVALIATVCLATFAVACSDKTGDDNGDNGGISSGDPTGGNEDTFATTTFTVIVLDKDGNPIDGTTDAGWVTDMTGAPTAAQIQFCAVMEDGTLGTCARPVDIGADGKATIALSTLVSTQAELEKYGDTVTAFELHICNVESKGYDKGDGNAAYGRYEVDKIPLTIEVTLKLTSEVE